MLFSTALNCQNKGQQSVKAARFKRVEWFYRGVLRPHELKLCYFCAFKVTWLVCSQVAPAGLSSTKIEQCYTM